MPTATLPPRFAPRLLLAASLAAPMALASAFAQEPEIPPEFTITTDRGWEGGAVAFPNTNRFSHCGIQRVYDNGTTLLFNTNPLYQSTISLLNPDWALDDGHAQEVEMQIDQILGGSAQAIAGGPQLLVIPIGEDQQIIEALQRGNVLYFGMEQGNLEFPLTGTFDALGALRECVDLARELAEEAAAAAPVPGDPPLATPLRPGQGPMTVESLASLLQTSGLQEFRIIDPEQIPESALDLGHVWTLDPVLAGVHQRPLNANSDLAAFTNDYAQAILSFCVNDPTPAITEPVTFATGFSRQTMTVECEVAENQTNAIYLITVRDEVAYTAFVQQAGIVDQPAVIAASEQLGAFIDALFAGVQEAIEGTSNGEAVAEPSASEDPAAGPSTPVPLPEDTLPELNAGPSSGG